MKKISLVLFLLVFGLQGLSAQQLILRDPVIFNAVNAIDEDIMQAHVEKLVSFYTRHNLSATTLADKGIGAAAHYIYAFCADYAAKYPEQIRVQRVPYTVGGEGTRLPRQVTLENIEIQLFFGVKANEANLTQVPIYIGMAHYDSRTADNNDGEAFAPGANDNGSGVATLMELVRILSPLTIEKGLSSKPSCLTFLFVSGEEHGLLGAQHMAKRAKEAGWRIEAVINNDMIGNSSSSETELRNNVDVRIFAGETEGPIREFGRYVKEVGERYVDQLTVRLVFRNDRFGRGGDHTPFNQQGFTAVRMTEQNENYDRTHQDTRTEPDPKRPGKTLSFGDVVSGVDFAYVRKNAGVNLAVLLNLALAPEAPKGFVMHTRGLSNQTRLSWEAPKDGPQATAWYVLMRDTDQPLWQRKIRVESCDVSIPYSKDNYFFAVQAVDDKGHESLIVK